MLYDPLPEMIMSKKKDVDMIRKAEDAYHIEAAKQPRPIINRKPGVSKYQFNYKR